MENKLQYRKFADTEVYLRMQFDYFKGLSLPVTPAQSEVFKAGFRELKERILGHIAKKEYQELFVIASKCEIRVIMDQ